MRQRERVRALVLETLLPLAEERGTTLETTGDVALPLGSPPLLLQLVTNLVHNAIVHNLPGGGTVAVRTAARPGWTTLTVESTGERLAPELVAPLAEPFRRGTGRVRADDACVGLSLGLAIVASIARAHGGGLTLTPRAAGGLHVAVRLPTAPAAG